MITSISSSHLRKPPHVGENGMKGRSKSMDTSSHNILDLLLEDDTDQSSHHQYHNHHCERPAIRSMSMDGSCHLQLKNRFDAVTEEPDNFYRNANMTDLTFLAKTKSPRRPERQPSLLIRNDHKNVSNKSHSNSYDTPATTTATTNRQRHRRTSPSAKQQQLPPSVVYIQKHHCEWDSVSVKCSSIDVFGSKNCGSSSLATTQSTHQQLQPEEECRRANSPRRPIRRPSCVIESPVQVFPTAITATGREASPRRPVRRPSVL